MRLERIARFFGLSHKPLTPPHNLQDIKLAEPSSSKNSVNIVCDASKQREASLTARPVTPGGEVYETQAKLNPKGQFVILVTGTYGAGKDSILSKLLNDPSLNITQPVRYTSRNQRPTEVNGREYHFVSREAFEKMAEGDEFLLHGELTGNYYGTSVQSLQNAFDTRKNLILIQGDDEIDGMRKALSTRNIPFIEAFISPVSKDVLQSPGGIDKALEILKTRMEERETSNIEIRLEKSRRSLQNIHKDAYILANETGKLESAIKEVSALIKTVSKELEQTTPIVSTDYLFTLPLEETFPCFEGQGKIDSKGNLAVIVVGPFAGGKNSVVDSVIESNSNLQQVVEHTSRDKRPGEIEGKEYFFVSKEEFERMTQNNEILIWFEWGGTTKESYGYSVEEIQKAFNNDKIPVLVQGSTNSGPMRSALNRRGIPNLVVFISPVSREDLKKDGGIDNALKILEKRMEGTERNKVAERQEISRAMFESLPDDISVIDNSNGNLERAAVDFLSLIQAKKEELKTKSLASKSPQLKFLETGELPEINLDTTKMKANKNIAVIVTGPSGVGKDTIFKELAKDIKFTEPLSHTTRLKRKEEKEGVNYYYVSMDEFEKMINSNNFVEWVMVHNDQFYGKTVETTQRALDSGNDLVYAINTSAKEYYKAVFEKFGIPYIDMFISPISKEELEKPLGIDKAVSILEKRIRRRNSGETEEQIQDRLKVAREWLQEAKKYSHIIANVEGGLDNAVREFKQILLVQK